MDHVTTLPNIMKEFNPGLMGCSEDLSNSLEESLNVGKVQATTINITAQTNLLSERIRNNPDINYENDWKLVTVLMGYNDICVSSCFDNSLGLVGQWISNVDQALTIMYLERLSISFYILGRATTSLRFLELANNTFCDFVFQSFWSCLLQAANSSLPDMVGERFGQGLTELVESRKYEKTNSFTVVVQPSLPIFRENVTEMELSYLAPDCMHLSGSGNRLFATYLWNNMLRPVGSKHNTLTRESPSNCPSDDFPCLYTYLNSEGECTLGNTL